MSSDVYYYEYETRHIFFNEQKWIKFTPLYTEANSNVYAATTVIFNAILKNSMDMRIDQDVIEWYKHQGPGYQSKVNAVLRMSMQTKSATARKVPSQRKMISAGRIKPEKNRTCRTVRRKREWQKQTHNIKCFFCFKDAEKT